jgi:hypothetical protein
MPAVNEIAPIYAEDTGAEDDLYLPRQRPKRDTRSKLVRSKEKAGGLIVNACPFGCPDEALDHTQYCKHMVGTTDDNDKRLFFPIKFREPPRPGIMPMRFSDGTDPQLVQSTDVLVRIHTCYRVYRENPGPPIVVENRLKRQVPAVVAEPAVPQPAAGVDSDEVKQLLAWAKANGYPGGNKAQTTPPAEQPE